MRPLLHPGCAARRTDGKNVHIDDVSSCRSRSPISADRANDDVHKHSITNPQLQRCRGAARPCVYCNKARVRTATVEDANDDCFQRRFGPAKRHGHINQLGKNSSCHWRRHQWGARFQSGHGVVQRCPNDPAGTTRPLSPTTYPSPSAALTRLLSGSPIVHPGAGGTSHPLLSEAKLAPAAAFACCNQPSSRSSFDRACWFAPAPAARGPDTLLPVASEAVDDATVRCRANSSASKPATSAATLGPLLSST